MDQYNDIYTKRNIYTVPDGYFEKSQAQLLCMASTHRNAIKRVWAVAASLLVLVALSLTLAYINTDEPDYSADNWTLMADMADDDILLSYY